MPDTMCTCPNPWSRPSSSPSSRPWPAGRRQASVFILDTLFIGGIKFVLRRVAEAVDAQMNDVDTLRQELLAAQMRVELGEMTEAEFAEIEGALLARLREIQERAHEEGGDAVRIVGVDVSVHDGVDDEPSDA